MCYPVFPFFAGKADLTVVRVLRKAIPGLNLNPNRLRNRIFEDIQVATGKSHTSAPNSDSPEGDRKYPRIPNKLRGSPLILVGPKVESPGTGNRLRATAQSFVPSTFVPRNRDTISQEKEFNRRASNSPPKGNTRRPPPPNQFKCSVFVSHIASGATWHDLQSAFSTQVAPTLRVYMKPGCSWAHVYFYDLKGVELAIEAAAAGLIKICGRPARVRRRTRKKKIKRSQSSVSGSPPSKSSMIQGGKHLTCISTNPNSDPFANYSAPPSLRNEWELKETNPRKEMQTFFHNGSDNGQGSRRFKLSFHNMRRRVHDNNIEASLSNNIRRLDLKLEGALKRSAFSSLNQPATVSSLFSTAPGF